MGGAWGVEYLTQALNVLCCVVSDVRLFEAYGIKPSPINVQVCRVCSMSSSIRLPLAAQAYKLNENEIAPYGSVRFVVATCWW